MTISRALLLIVILELPALAARTDPGQETIWDQIMQQQAQRELYEGSVAMEKRNYERAIQQFAKAVATRPQDATARMMLGAAYYWSGQVPQAETEFKEALRLEPKNAQAHLLMGIVHAWRGDAHAAYASFKESERLAPERADVQMNLGSIEETLGLLPQALDHFRRAVALDPQSALYHFQLAMLYRRLGRNSDSIDSLRLAIKRYPDFEDAILELGAALERQGEHGDAADLFRRAVRLKSRDSVARLRLGRVYLLSGKPEKTRDALRDAFHLTPEEAGGGLALNVSFGGQSKKAGPAPEKPAGSQPEAANDPLEVLRRNLERIPLDKEAKLSIEMAILPRPKLEPVKKEESALKKALEAAGKPKSGAVGVKREFSLRPADAATRQAQIDKVIDELRKVKQQAPADAEVRMGMNLQFAQAAQTPSFSDAENGPKASYQPRQVGNDLGLWVMGTGWMDLVEEILPEANEDNPHPDQPLWWVIDGLAYAALGNGRLALESFERALKLDPKEETALLGKSVAMVELGREADAIAAYKEVLAVNPKNRAAKDGLAWLLREPASKGRKK